MADLKISQLTGATTPLAGTEVLPVVQGSTTKQVAVSNLTAGRAVSMDSLLVGTTTSGGFNAVVSKQGTGVVSYMAIRAGEGGSASTSNVSVLYYRIRGGGAGDVDGSIQYSYTNATSSYALTYNASGNHLFNNNIIAGTTIVPDATNAGTLIAGNPATQSSVSATTATTTVRHWKFINGNGQVGAIATNGTATAYEINSDSRLKIDAGVATDTSVIDNTIIHDFKWKINGEVDRGVFAQEAYLVKPTAIGVGTDEINEAGNLNNPWGVDYSKYVPDLIVHAQQLKKQVQEQQALIASLSKRIAALEAAK